MIFSVQAMRNVLRVSPGTVGRSAYYGPTLGVCSTLRDEGVNFHLGEAGNPFPAASEQGPFLF